MFQPLEEKIREPDKSDESDESDKSDKSNKSSKSDKSNKSSKSDKSNKSDSRRWAEYTDDEADASQVDSPNSAEMPTAADLSDDDTKVSTSEVVSTGIPELTPNQKKRRRKACIRNAKLGTSNDAVSSNASVDVVATQESKEEVSSNASVDVVATQESKEAVSSNASVDVVATHDSGDMVSSNASADVVSSHDSSDMVSAQNQMPESTDIVIHASEMSIDSGKSIENSPVSKKKKKQERQMTNSAKKLSGKSSILVSTPLQKTQSLATSEVFPILSSAQAKSSEESFTQKDSTEDSETKTLGDLNTAYLKQVYILMMEQVSRMKNSISDNETLMRETEKLRKLIDRIKTLEMFELEAPSRVENLQHGSHSVSSVSTSPPSDPNKVSFAALIKGIDDTNSFIEVKKHSASKPHEKKRFRVNAGQLATASDSFLNNLYACERLYDMFEQCMTRRMLKVVQAAFQRLIDCRFKVPSDEDQPDSVWSGNLCRKPVEMLLMALVQGLAGVKWRYTLRKLMFDDKNSAYHRLAPMTFNHYAKSLVEDSTYARDSVKAIYDALKDPESTYWTTEIV